jgi:hypothetical protein
VLSTLIYKLHPDLGGKILDVEPCDLAPQPGDFVMVNLNPEGPANFKPLLVKRRLFSGDKIEVWLIHV